MSISNQTYRNIEVIIIDDGSHDCTKDSVDEFVVDYPHEVKYLYQDHKGVSAARNLGLRLATGLFVAFVDSDDLLINTHFENLVNMLNSNSEIKIAFSSVQYFGSGSDVLEKSHLSGRFINTVLKSCFSFQGGYAWKSTPALLRTLLNQGVYFRCPSALINRELLLNNSLFFSERLSFTEDAHFLLQVAFYTGFMYTEEVGYLIRRHHENEKDRCYFGRVAENCEVRIREMNDFFFKKHLDNLTKRALRHRIEELTSEVIQALKKNNKILEAIIYCSVSFMKKPSIRLIKNVLQLILLQVGR